MSLGNLSYVLSICTTNHHFREYINMVAGNDQVSGRQPTTKITIPNSIDILKKSEFTDGGFLGLVRYTHRVTLGELMPGRKYSYHIISCNESQVKLFFHKKIELFG